MILQKMKLDLNQVLFTLDGRVLRDIKNIEDWKTKDGSIKYRVEEKDLTLYRILSLAMIEPVHKIADNDKEKYFELAVRLNASKAGIVELCAEDVVFLKNAVVPKYDIVIVGQTLRMLEGMDTGIVRTKEEPPISVEAVEEWGVQNDFIVEESGSKFDTLSLENRASKI